MTSSIDRAPRLVLLALSLAVAGCGQWQRVGGSAGGGAATSPEPDPNIVVPRLFRTTETYRDMGLLVTGDPLPFVASMGFFAGPTPDSAFVAFGLSLTNNALTFRKADDHFEAEYSVEVGFDRNGTSLAHLADEQLVRVATFAETQRHDESVIFQQFLKLPPGDASVTVLVRDLKGRVTGRTTGKIAVPRFGSGQALSSLVPVYRSRGRSSLSEVPQVVLNPRSAMPYQSDTLYLYLEAYRVPPRSTANVRAIDQHESVIWEDTIVFDRGAAGSDLAVAEVGVGPELLPVGQLLFEASVPAMGVTASTKALISFSDQWAVSNFEEVLSLLRYFGQDRAIRRMRDAPVAERALLWKEFWERTDPNPMTSEHEDINEYFQRLSQANELFREPGTPGWLTDRGEVVVTLGAPDEIYDSSSDVQSRAGLRVIRWNYISERLTVDFIDDNGFGRFRLTPASRAEYMRILNMMRRSG